MAPIASPSAGHRETDARDYRRQCFLHFFLLELFDEFELELLEEFELELLEEFELELLEEFELELPAEAGAAASAPATTRLVAPTAARFQRRSQGDSDAIASLLLACWIK